MLRSQNSGEVPITIRFSDRSTGEVEAWSWDFDGDMIVDSTDANPEYTYTEAGCYAISLKVTGPGGEDLETKKDYLVLTSP